MYVGIENLRVVGRGAVGVAVNPAVWDTIANHGSVVDVECLEYGEIQRCQAVASVNIVELLNCGASVFESVTVPCVWEQVVADGVEEAGVVSREDGEMKVHGTVAAINTVELTRYRIAVFEDESIPRVGKQIVADGVEEADVVCRVDAKPEKYSAVGTVEVES